MSYTIRSNSIKVVSKPNFAISVTWLDMIVSGEQSLLFMLFKATSEDGRRQVEILENTTIAHYQ